eukprot:scaffold8221_cov71-Isochrysis_galbana.AAC.1
MPRRPRPARHRPRPPPARRPSACPPGGPSASHPPCSLAPRPRRPRQPRPTAARAPAAPRAPSVWCASAAGRRTLATSRGRLALQARRGAPEA